MPKQINYSKLPVYMQLGAQRYIEEGRLSGDFLFAVFSNNLIGTYNHADEHNLKAIPEWVGFLYNEAPAECWGSSAKVDAWVECGGLKGKPPAREIIVVGPNVWGRGATIDEARKKCRKQTGNLLREYLVYDVPVGTTVNSVDGSLVYDPGPGITPPVLLKAMRNGKEVPKP